MRSVYQDRLGTNIGKALKNRGRFLSTGHVLGRCGDVLFAIPFHTVSTEYLPRQARDKHRVKTSLKRGDVSAGSTKEMSRRERPQLVLSAQGQPRYFSSGVQDVAVRNILMFKLNLFGEPF